RAASFPGSSQSGMHRFNDTQVHRAEAMPLFMAICQPLVEQQVACPATLKFSATVGDETTQDTMSWLPGTLHCLCKVCIVIDPDQQIRVRVFIEQVGQPHRRGI